MAKILIADDEAIIRILLRQAFRQFPELRVHEVEMCSDGSEAWGKWVSAMRCNASFDLALLDAVMPGLPGVRLANMIHAHGPGRNMPVIIMSGQERPADWPDPQPFLKKPFDFQALVALVTRLLSDRSATPPRVPTPPPAPATPAAPA